MREYKGTTEKRRGRKKRVEERNGMERCISHTMLKNDADLTLRRASP